MHGAPSRLRDGTERPAVRPAVTVNKIIDVMSQQLTHLMVKRWHLFSMHDAIQAALADGADGQECAAHAEHGR